MVVQSYLEYRITISPDTCCGAVCLPMSCAVIVPSSDDSHHCLPFPDMTTRTGFGLTAAQPNRCNTFDTSCKGGRNSFVEPAAPTKCEAQSGATGGASCLGGSMLKACAKAFRPNTTTSLPTPNNIKIQPAELAYRIVEKPVRPSLLLVDCRSFLQYNVGHIEGALNISCSDRFKQKRLVSGKLKICDLISPTDAKKDWNQRTEKEIVLYDEDTTDVSSSSGALNIIFNTLEKEGTKAKILEGRMELQTCVSVPTIQSQSLTTSIQTSSHPPGGLMEFRICHGDLLRSGSATDHAVQTPSACMPPTPAPVSVRPEDQPISKVLPYLYLGNEADSLSVERLQRHGITAVLNVTKTSPMPPPEANVKCLRLPASDNCSQNLTRYFKDAYDFIEATRQSGGRVLVHCFAGISRSATVTLAYLMRHDKMPLSEAYSFVKHCRPVISPNLNFMGQLLQLEESLQRQRSGEATPQGDKDDFLPPVSPPSTPIPAFQKSVSCPGAPTDMLLDAALHIPPISDSGSDLSNAASQQQCLALPLPASYVKRTTSCMAKVETDPLAMEEGP